MANLKVSENPLPFLPFTDSADPANPAAGQKRLWVDTDDLLKMVDESGTVTTFAASGGVATDTIWDAAGDLVQGTGPNTGARLAVGSTNRLLKVVAGSAAWGLPHAFGCIISGTSTALSSGAYVSLSYGAADTYDPDAYHDPSGAPTLITIPTGLGGIYCLKAHCSWPNTTTADTQKRIAYRINGGADVAQIPFRTVIATEPAATVGFGSMAVDLSLSAGDTVEVRQFVTNANAQTSTVYAASLFLVGVA